MRWLAGCLKILMGLALVHFQKYWLLKVAHNRPPICLSTGPAAQTSPELIFHIIEFNMSQDSSVSTDLWSKRHFNTDAPSKEPLRFMNHFFATFSDKGCIYTMEWNVFGNCDLKGVFQTVKGWILNTIQSWNVQVGCHQIYLCYC